MTVLLAGSSVWALVPVASATITVDAIDPVTGSVFVSDPLLPLNANVSGQETGGATVDSIVDWQAGDLDNTSLIVGGGGTLQLRRIDREDFAAGNVPDSYVWDTSPNAVVANGVLSLYSDSAQGITLPTVRMNETQGGYDLRAQTNLTVETRIEFYTQNVSTGTFGVGFTDGDGNLAAIRVQENGSGGVTYTLEWCTGFTTCTSSPTVIEDTLGNPAGLRVVIDSGTSGQINGSWFNSSTSTWDSLGIVTGDFVSFQGPWSVFSGSLVDLAGTEDFSMNVDYIALNQPLYFSTGTYRSEPLDTGLYPGARLVYMNLTTSDTLSNGITAINYRTAPLSAGPWSPDIKAVLGTELNGPANKWVQFMITLTRDQNPSWPDKVSFLLDYATEVGAYWLDDFPDGPAGVADGTSWMVSTGGTSGEGLDLDSTMGGSIGVTYRNDSWDLADRHKIEGVTAVRIASGGADLGVMFAGFLAQTGGSTTGHIGVVHAANAGTQYWAVAWDDGSGPGLSWMPENSIQTSGQALVRFEMEDGVFSAMVLEVDHPERGWLDLGAHDWTAATGTASWRIGDAGSHSGNQRAVVDWAALLLGWMTPDASASVYSSQDFLLNEDLNTRAVIAFAGPTWSIQSAGYRYDSIPPVGSFTINGGVAYSTSVAVDLTIGATDRYGVTFYAASESLSFPEGWKAFSPGTTPFTAPFILSPEDGRHVVWIRFMDGSGVISEPVNQSIALDQVNPTGAIYLNNRSAYANSEVVDLTLLAFDSGGVDGAWVSNSADLSDATFVDMKQSGVALPAASTTVSWTLSPGDGVKTVYAQLADIHSRLSSLPLYDDAILVDTTSPSVSASLRDGVDRSGTTYLSTSHAVVHVTAVDASGVSRVDIAESASFADAVSFTGAGDLTYDLPEQSGARTLFVRAVDIYNLTSGTTRLEFFVDINAPVGTISIESGTEVVKVRTVQLQIEATDNVGVADMMLSTSLYFPNAEWQPYESTATIELSPGDGTGKTVYVRFRDVNGRVSQAFVDTISLDTTPPTGFIIVNNGDLSTPNPSLNLDMQAYDNFAGQLEYRVSTTASFGNSTWLPFTDTMLFDARTQDANVTVYYQVRDANGWESIVYTDSIRVRPPTCQEANTCPGIGNAPGFDGSFAAVAMAVVAAAAVVVRRRRMQ